MCCGSLEISSNSGTLSWHAEAEFVGLDDALDRIGRAPDVAA